METRGETRKTVVVYVPFEGKSLWGGGDQDPGGKFQNAIQYQNNKNVILLAP